MNCVRGAFMSIIFLFIILWQMKLIVADEIHWDRIELKNETYNSEYYNVSLLRIAKFNRTTYTLNLKIELLIDFNEEFEIGAAYFYNRFNNNQYTRSIIRIPKMNLCEGVEKFYPMAVTEAMKTKTNFPEVIPGKKWCPLKKVNSNQF